MKFLRNHQEVIHIVCIVLFMVALVSAAAWGNGVARFQ